MWQPQHGNMVMEARLKVDNVSDLAILGRVHRDAGARPRP